jgi:hypothetical protein
MGRPAEFTRDQILDAALGVAAGGGHDTVTMTAIAARLNAPTGGRTRHGGGRHCAGNGRARRVRTAYPRIDRRRPRVRSRAVTGYRPSAGAASREGLEVPSERPAPGTLAVLSSFHRRRSVMRSILLAGVRGNEGSATMRAGRL